MRLHVCVHGMHVCACACTVHTCVVRACACTHASACVRACAPFLGMTTGLGSDHTQAPELGTRSLRRDAAHASRAWRFSRLLGNMRPVLTCLATMCPVGAWVTSACWAPGCQAGRAPGLPTTAPCALQTSSSTRERKQIFLLKNLKQCHSDNRQCDGNVGDGIYLRGQAEGRTSNQAGGTRHAARLRCKDPRGTKAAAPPPVPPHASRPPPRPCRKQCGFRH